MKEPPPEATNTKETFYWNSKHLISFLQNYVLRDPTSLRRDNSLPGNSDDQFEVDNMKGKLPWKIELYRSFDMEWNLSLMNTICHSCSAVKNGRCFYAKRKNLKLLKSRRKANNKIMRSIFAGIKPKSFCPS